MNFIKRLLYVPKHQKESEVTDEVLTRSIVTSVISVLICMACLFGLTWAWFSATVTAGTNKLTAAGYGLDVSVTEQGSSVKLTDDADGYYVLDPAKSYSVSLKKDGTATSGFCQLAIVSAESASATPFYTNSIPRAGKPADDKYTFTLKGVTKVKFSPMWGKCSETRASRFIGCGDTLSFAVPDDEPGLTETPPEEIPEEEPAQEAPPEEKPLGEGSEQPEEQE